MSFQIPNKSDPQRTCVGCRKRRSASELVRFALYQGELGLGPNRPGRGAWLCADTPVVCFDAAIIRKAVPRALKTDITQAQLDSLRVALTTGKDCG